MSLVTCCPACGTAFHVKPEQLAAHRGDVRCGKCANVFNALAHLTETAPTAEEAKSVAAENPVETIPGAVEAPAAAENAPASPAIPGGEEHAVEMTAEPERKLVQPAPPEFKLTPARPAKRPLSPWLLTPLGLLLLLLALGQTLYFLRTEVAARLPHTRPYLEQACAVLGCIVELPRQALLLGIDDSDLREDAAHQDVFILTSTLVNRAAFAQAYPLLELTLTDLSDRPVLRRAISPHEYLPQGTDPDSGLAAGGEIHVKLSFTADGIKATGYRIYVTYP